MTGLDAFDIRILALLQADATLPSNVIAERVGLSPTPCWRRIRKLEQAGIIKRRVAILDRKKLNVGVTVFIAIRTREHTSAWLDKLRTALADIPEVIDFYRLAGEIDYLIRAVLPNVEAYDDLYKRLIARVEFSDVTSMFAMEEIKSTTEIPLSYVDL